MPTVQLDRIGLLQENIPSELKMRKQWVCYQARPRSGKIAKVPIDPYNGLPINAQDENNWLTFESAIQQIKSGNLNVSCIGFVFTASDPYVGIDIDHCIDESGNWNEVSQTVFDYLKSDGYVEISPSGKGIHLIVKGIKWSTLTKNTVLGIEMYSEGRYFTMTGNAITQNQQIQFSNKLSSIEEMYFKTKQEQATEPLTYLTDEQILEQMFKCKNGNEIQRLFDGDISMYGNESSADLALCNHLAFYTQKDAFLMDKLFRMSGLYRSKWDERHSADGRTYGQMTIEKALAGTSNVYSQQNYRLEKRQQHNQYHTIQEKESENHYPWYKFLKSGSNPKFLPGILASHISNQNNLIYSQAHFFKNKNGIYIKVDDKAIETEILRNMLEEYSKIQQVRDTLEQLKLKTYSEIDLYDVARLKGKIIFQNGIYDIASKTLQSHSADFKVALQINASFNENATCPEFMNFLQKAVGEQDQLVIQELLGYLLTVETKAEKAFILFGPGRTGKSTFLKAVEHILGEQNVSNVSLQGLAEKFSIGSMYGKLLNTFADLPTKPLSDTGIFKALVSGDRILGENKFKDPFFFRNTAKLLFSCNELPTNYVDRTDGFFRRLLIIPFLNQIPENEVDPDLFEKLIQETDGIVQWGLQGLHRLIENNYQFTVSDSSKQLLNQYRKESNNVIWFVEEYCSLDLCSRIMGQDLYAYYQKKCLESNKQHISKMKFYQSLEKEYKSIVRYEDPSRAVAFKGIAIM